MTLPVTPAHNTLGEALKDVLPIYAPEGDEIVPVRLNVDGNTFVPPVERTHVDMVLWNALDTSFTPEAFAKLTCDEVGLPLVFEPHIAGQIRNAVKEHRQASQALALATRAPNAPGAPGGVEAQGSMPPPPPPGAGQPQQRGTLSSSSAAASSAGGGGERLVTLHLHVRDAASGLELHDKVLWDAGSEALTPEAFARQLCADMTVHDLEGQVAFAVREQLAKANARFAARVAGVAVPAAAASSAEAAAANGNGEGSGEGGDKGGEGEEGSEAMVVDDFEEVAPVPGSVVRSEREALEWSPRVIPLGGPAAADVEARRQEEAKEAERRDTQRRKAKGPTPANGAGA